VRRIARSIFNLGFGLGSCGSNRFLELIPVDARAPQFQRKVLLSTTSRLNALHKP
jgi:hypothetical protein